MKETEYCNGYNNYYGDQVCERKEPKPKCNYDNDYYGDQFCWDGQTIQR